MQRSGLEWFLPALLRTAPALAALSAQQPAIRPARLLPGDADKKYALE